MITKLIFLSLIYVLVRAYDSDRRLTYNQEYIISNSDDTLVRVSKSLVSFWFKSIDMTCFHKKNDFLKGVTSSAS